MNKKNYIGKTVGQWFILKENGRNSSYTQLYDAKCVNCGYTIKQATIARLQKHVDCRHHVLPSWKGLKHLKQVFEGMYSRCYYKGNPHYNRYGGRGIIICDEWLYDRNKFIQWSLSHGYRDDLTIDRIDNDGNYCPENCRWVTKRENNQNKPNIPKYIYKGKNYTTPELSALLTGNPDKFGEYRKYNGKAKLDEIIHKFETGEITEFPNGSKRMITVNGKTMSVSDWDRYLGTDDTMFLSNWSKHKKRTDDMVVNKIREIMKTGVKHHLPKQYFIIHGHKCSAEDILGLTDKFVYSRSILKRVKKHGHKATEDYLNKIIPTDTNINTNLVIQFDSDDDSDLPKGTW